LLPALDALRAAVADDEDDTARAILNGLRARAPRERSVQGLLDAFERVLQGRALVRSLELDLASERVTPPEGQAAPDQDAPAPPPRFRLVLEAHHAQPEPLTFRLPPAVLEHLVVAIDPRGVQTKSLEERPLAAFDELTIEPHTTLRLPLFEYDLPLGGALALRDQWAVRMHAGSVIAGSEELPAARISSALCEQTVLAPFLPHQPLEPSVLAEYVQREHVYLPPLLERTVRIPSERRDEALSLLAPIVERFQRERPTRLQEILPALSWLLHSTDGGDDVVSTLLARGWEAGRGKAASAGDLVLPDGRRAAPPDAGSAAAPSPQGLPAPSPTRGKQP